MHVERTHDASSYTHGPRSVYGGASLAHDASSCQHRPRSEYEGTYLATAILLLFPFSLFSSVLLDRLNQS
jgi:hypothetical protein